MKYLLMEKGRNLLIGRNIPMNEGLKMLEDSYRDILTVKDILKEQFFMDCLKARINLFRDFYNHAEKMKSNRKRVMEKGLDTGFMYKPSKRSKVGYVQVEYK